MAVYSRVCEGLLSQGYWELIFQELESERKG